MTSACKWSRVRAAEITKLKEEQHADTVTVEFQSGYLPHRVLQRHAVAQSVVFFLLFLHTQLTSLWQTHWVRSTSAKSKG